jgi:hypothetical protein
MAGAKTFKIVLLSAALLPACSCDPEDVAVPDSVIAHAQIQSAIIPQSVAYGTTLRISVRVLEGCRFGDWQGAEIRLDKRNIYVETRARVFFDLPPDCVTSEEIYSVPVSFGSEKGSQSLPPGLWDVFVVGRNTTVTGRVKVS